MCVLCVCVWCVCVCGVCVVCVCVVCVCGVCVVCVCVVCVVCVCGVCVCVVCVCVVCGCVSYHIFEVWLVIGSVTRTKLIKVWVWSLRNVISHSLLVHIIRWWHSVVSAVQTIEWAGKCLGKFASNTL